VSGQRIGFLGGTFNPPHWGHVHAANAAQQELALDRVLLIPDATPPHKRIPPDSPTAQQRYEMTALTAPFVTRGEACDLELQRPGPSYTAVTAELLRERFPGDELWLIVGTDMLCSMERWFAPERIFACCGVVAVRRQEEDLDILELHAEKLRQIYGARISVAQICARPLSSTDVRAAGEDLRRTLLPEPVFAYIAAHGLYQRR